VSKPHAAFLGVTTLTFIKPRLRRILRPITSYLAHAGVTANQVTMASIIGSLVVGLMLCRFPNAPASFVELRIWLVVRTFCASIDGTLAIEYGQKSRLGGFLNEAGDIISDIALFFPLAFVQPFSPALILFLIALMILCEVSGMIGPLLGSDRRLEGPLGKSDRSMVLAIVGWVIALHGRLPEIACLLVPVLSIGLALTIWNRLRFALADSRWRADGRMPVSHAYRRFIIRVFAGRSRTRRLHFPSVSATTRLLRGFSQRHRITPCP
jgi:CDP-diacylglycerol--glycerol-3-phosphate 3-phosphatidyltransferase